MRYPWSRGGVPLLVSCLIAPLNPAGAGAPEPMPQSGHRPELGGFEESNSLPEFAGPAAPPLERLLELARQRSPRLAEAASRAAAAERLVGAAKALEDPMLEARLSNAGVDDWTVGEMEMSAVEVGVRQNLPWPGRRAARQGLAAAEAAVFEVGRVVAEREVDRAVVATAARIWALDEELARLDDGHELMSVLVAGVDVRLAAGTADTAAAIRSRLELVRHDAERERAAAEREREAARLRELLALPAATPIGRIAGLPRPEPLPADFVRLAGRTAPGVIAAEARALVAERQVELLRRDLKPDLAVAAGIGWRGDLDPMVQAGAAIELPIFRRQRERPRLEAAADELAAARSAASEAALAARGEAEEIAAAVRRLDRRILLFDEGLLPQSAASFDAARSAFLGGSGDFSTLLSAFDLWLTVRVDRARLTAERLELAAAAAALIGSSPETRSSLAPAGDSR